MIKNKQFIILSILTISLIAVFGLQQFALSNGAGGVGVCGPGIGSDADAAPGQFATDSSANAGIGGGGGGDNWNYTASSPTLNFNVPSVVEFPDPVPLTWESKNTNSCTASLDPDWSGSKSVSGNQSIPKSIGTYTFKISCSGSGGTVSDTKTTKVVQVPRGYFTATPSSIVPPEISTLSWDVQYAYSCFIDNGIGSVNASGSKDVSPTDTTTFILTCDGLDGQRSFSATVTVGFSSWLREVLPK